MSMLLDIQQVKIGSSNLGVASFLYDRFTIDTQNVVDIRDKSITLGKMQNIGPKTLLSNNGH